MIFVTTEEIPGRRIVRVLGVAAGSTIRAKHIGKDFLSGFKNIVGGELTWYTEMMEEARDEATKRMLDNAARMGANAVVNVRLSTASLMQGAAEVYAYGTAVVVE
ncbi:MAG: YbjQ family protein [Thermoplasmatota archaeon]